MFSRISVQDLLGKIWSRNRRVTSNGRRVKNSKELSTRVYENKPIIVERLRPLPCRKIVHSREILSRARVRILCIIIYKHFNGKGVICFDPPGSPLSRALSDSLVLKKKIIFVKSLLRSKFLEAFCIVPIFFLS